MRVLVSGSHGLIGTALVERLRELDHQVVRLVRSKPTGDDIVWDPATAAMDTERIEGFDAVVHLGGVGLGEKRWTLNEKEKIWNSRVVSTDLLSKRLAEAIDRPSVFVIASGIGYYGNGEDRWLEETSPKGEGFLSDLVAEWEDAAQDARDAGIRTVHLRSGVVLSAKGGAIARQLPLFRFGLGGRLGPGTQYLSWITLHDEVEAIVFALTNDKVSGAINLCTPNPVTNAEFTEVFGKLVRRPTFIPVWRWMLDAAFGKEMTDEMLLISQRARPAALLAAGFSFEHPGIKTGLEWVLDEEAAARNAKAEAKRIAEEELETKSKRKRKKK